MKGKARRTAVLDLPSQIRASVLEHPRPHADETQLQQDSQSLCLARLVAISPRGEPVLQLDGELVSRILPAQTMVDLTSEDIGMTAVVQFERANPNRPVVLGLLRTAQRQVGVNGSAKATGFPAIEVDGESLRIECQREIVFRCGSASITLTRSGKVLIKGEYVSSRSTGTNRIKGGSVQIN